jgi:hypothetical protein
MEQALRLVVVLFAALTAGGLMVSWIGLGRAMSRLSDSAYVDCDVAVLAIALATNFRINKQIARRSVQSPPDEWAPTRARWVRFHILPALFSLPGLASCVLACPVSRCSVVGS